MKTLRRVAPVIVVCLAGWSSADAYTIKSAVTAGCHERITSDALRAVRLELSTAAPLPLTRNEEALVHDLQFKPDADMADLGAATLLAGVRDNDLMGRGSGDLSALAEIHGDPGDQDHHCLRGPTQAEPGGSEAAVADCRAFIRGRILEALDGLDDAGAPDPSKRSSLKVHLSIRGTVEASLPTYYLRMGQAIHAIQDSFAHTYRTADGQQITVVLNWLAFVDKSLVESRDGPAHATELDVCDDPDELRRVRRLLATDASAAVLRATLNPDLTRDEKIAAVDQSLDAYLGFTPGCTSDNQWCDAAESKIPSPTGCGCGSGGSGLGALTTLLVLLAAGWRARRSRPAARIVALLAMGLIAPLAVGSAQAQTGSGEAFAEWTPPASTEVAGEGAEPVAVLPTVAPAEEPGPPNPSQVALGASLSASGSVDMAGMAFDLGLRLRLSKHWTLGLEGEWNPWFAVNGARVRQGAINVYGMAIVRFPLAYENFNLRTSVSLGTSYLLTELYGAPAGSVGLFVALNPLSLEWKASRYFFLVISPASLAVPIPQLTGVPFIYPQYRLTLGLEFYAG